MYTEIIKLIDPYSLHTKNSPEDNSNMVLMLNKEQMLAGIKKNKVNVEASRANLDNLLECV